MTPLIGTKNRFVQPLKANQPMMLGAKGLVATPVALPAMKPGQSNWYKQVVADLNKSVIPTDLNTFKSPEKQTEVPAEKETDSAAPETEAETAPEKSEEKSDEDEAAAFGDKIADTPINPQQEESSCWLRGALLASGVSPDELQAAVNNNADDRSFGSGGSAGDMMEIMEKNGSQNVREDAADGASVKARLLELQKGGFVPVVVVMKEGHAYAVTINSGGEMVEMDNQNVRITEADLDNDGVYSMVSGEKKAKDAKAGVGAS